MEQAGAGSARPQDARPLASQCLRIPTSETGFPNSALSGCEPNQALKGLVNVVTGTTDSEGLQRFQVGDKRSGLQVAAIVMAIVHSDNEVTMTL